ncbi:MAG: hypothetical protein RIC80_14870 [Cyclobacteriaceae bacterium]
MSTTLKSIFGILTLMLSFYGTQAQETKGKSWSIQFTSGVSLPVGKFSKMDVNQTISMVEALGEGYYQWEGFNKNMNNSAEIGFLYTMSIKRQLSGNFHGFVDYISTQHNVETDPVRDFYYDTFSFFPTQRLEFRQDNYRFRGLIGGIGYTQSLGSFFIDFQLGLGYTSLDYPSYSWIVYGTKEGTTGVGSDYANIAPHSNPTSMALSVISGVKYPLGNFFIGVDFSFMTANFEYAVDLRSPGNRPIIRDETINYRVLNLGLIVGLRI